MRRAFTSWSRLPSSPASPDIVLDEIRGEMIAASWALIEPLLQRGIDRVATARTTTQIREGAEAGRYRLWAIYRRGHPLPLLAAAASYVRETNKGLVAVIEPIGGHDMRDWLLPVLTEFEAMAKANGVAMIEVEGRRGWQRVLPGFTTARVILQKVL